MTTVPLQKHPVPVGDINATGTPDDSTFLRGDGVWASPNGGGGGGGDGTTWLDPVPSGNGPGGTDDDEFDNETIDTTAVLGGGNATWVEKHDVLSADADGQTSGALAAQLTELTSPATGLIVETAVRVGYLADASDKFMVAGIVLADGTAASSTCVFAGFRMSGTGTMMFRRARGAFNSLTFDTQAAFRHNSPWLHVRLIWDSANTFTTRMSLDGATWVSAGLGNVSQTLTPTHMGVAVGGFDAGATALAAFEYLRAS